VKEKAPAFQFYPGDFLADENVMAMTATEVGAYWILVCLCWREGSIPADPARAARCAKNVAPEMIEGWLLECFEPHPDDETRLIHPRLERERRNQEEWREKSRRGGAESAKRRALAKQTSTKRQPSVKGGSSNAQPSVNTSSSSSSSSSIKGKKPAPLPTTAYGEFSRCNLTEGQHERLAGQLGDDLGGYIERYDSWVEEAPQAKAGGVRRQDRNPYLSIRRWYSDDQKNGGGTTRATRRPVRRGGDTLQNPTDPAQYKTTIYG
jgi:uncharacterized protein YdaU (DUF1376 family)